MAVHTSRLTRKDKHTESLIARSDQGVEQKRVQQRTLVAGMVEGLSALAASAPPVADGGEPAVNFVTEVESRTAEEPPRLG